MKKVAMVTAALGLMIPAPLMISTPARAGYNNIPAYCKNYVASGSDAELNRGECISLLTVQFHYLYDFKNDNTFSVHACDYYAENYPDVFDELWGSKKACVDEFLSTP